MIRRCTAFLLMLCLAFYSGESLVADVHDGDAAPAELLVSDAAHGMSHASASAAAASVPIGEVALLQNATGHTDTGDQSNPQPAHAQHACHCSHAHGFVDATPRQDAALALSDLSAPAAHHVRMPPSLEREPQLRPPILV